MVDAGRLAALLDRIAEELKELRALADRAPRELVEDPVALPAAKYRLVVAIEAAIDAGEHVIASEGLRASKAMPTSSRCSLRPAGSSPVSPPPCKTSPASATCSSKATHRSTTAGWSQSFGVASMTSTTSGVHWLGVPSTPKPAESPTNPEELGQDRLALRMLLDEEAKRAATARSPASRLPRDLQPLPQRQLRGRKCRGFCALHT